MYHMGASLKSILSAAQLLISLKGAVLALLAEGCIDEITFMQIVAWPNEAFSCLQL